MDEPAVKEMLPSLDDPGLRKLERYQQIAVNLVASHASLECEQLSEEELLKSLKACPAGHTPGDCVKRTHVVICYDQPDSLKHVLKRLHNA